jgi:predicted nucleic-acid-binding Zn-ribbon protein
MDAAKNSEKLIAWLNKKWQGNKNCPICSQNNWAVGSVLELREFNDGNLVVGGPITPVIPIICNNCGHTLMFNAIVSGIIESLKP